MVLYDISYENLIMYSRTLPSYNPDKTKGKERDRGEVLTSKADINKFMMEHAAKHKNG